MSSSEDVAGAVDVLWNTVDDVAVDAAVDAAFVGNTASDNIAHAANHPAEASFEAHAGCGFGHNNSSDQ